MKKIKLFIYIILILLFISIAISYHFYNIFLEKENNRDNFKINNIVFKHKNYYDDFKSSHINSINKKNIDQDLGLKYKVEDILSEDDYVKIKDFTIIYERELSKKFIPIMDIKKGYCEILINPKSKGYKIKDCIPNNIFKRSVELAIISFNDNFYMYDKVKNIDSNISVYFKYGDK